MLIAHIPKGDLNLVLLCIKWSFSGIQKFFSSGRGSCLALSGAGHAGGRLYTTVECESRPGSIARALGVQSREIWLSVELEPRKTTERKHFIFFALFLHHCCTATKPRYDTRSSFRRCYSHGHCLCGCGRAYGCIWECMRVCVCVCWHLEKLPLVRFFFVGIDM